MGGDDGEVSRGGELTQPRNSRRNKRTKEKTASATATCPAVSRDRRLSACSLPRRHRWSRSAAVSVPLYTFSPCPAFASPTPRPIRPSICRPLESVTVLRGGLQKTGWTRLRKGNNKPAKPIRAALVCVTEATKSTRWRAAPRSRFYSNVRFNPASAGRKRSAHHRQTCV